MESREYHIALQYVRQEYRELYSFADDIVVIPGNRMPKGQEGQCSPDRFIVISSSLGTVGQYVNVLVHELTHAKQFATGYCKGRGRDGAGSVHGRDFGRRTISY